MFESIRDIVVLAVVIAPFNVFIIEWIKSFMSKICVLADTVLAVISFMLSMSFGTIAYLSFMIELENDKMPVFSCFLLGLFILDTSQFVYKHFSLLEKLFYR